MFAGDCARNRAKTTPRGYAGEARRARGGGGRGGGGGGHRTPSGGRRRAARTPRAFVERSDAIKLCPTIANHLRYARVLDRSSRRHLRDSPPRPPRRGTRWSTLSRSHADHAPAPQREAPRPVESRPATPRARSPPPGSPSMPSRPVWRRRRWCVQMAASGDGAGDGDGERVDRGADGAAAGEPREPPPRPPRSSRVIGRARAVRTGAELGAGGCEVGSVRRRRRGGAVGVAPAAGRLVLSQEWPRTGTPPMARAAREGGERSTLTSGVMSAKTLSQ